MTMAARKTPMDWRKSPTTWMKAAETLMFSPGWFKGEILKFLVAILMMRQLFNSLHCIALVEGHDDINCWLVMMVVVTTTTRLRRKSWDMGCGYALAH